MTKEEIKKYTDKSTRKFMKSVKAFLATKAGNYNGEIPAEWECSIMLLEAYYRQFMELDMTIQDLDSVIVEGRYGPTVSPLCTARDKASCRLEALMKEMGLSMKSAIKLNVVEPQKEESALEKFMAKKNKGVEKR